MRPNSRIDWKWALPKLVFVVAVFTAVVYTVIIGFLDVSRKPHPPFDPTHMVLFLIGTWLTTEALEILFNRLSNPVEKAVDKAFTEAYPNLFTTIVRTDRDEALMELQAMYRTSKKCIDGISWKELNIAQKQDDPYRQEYFQVIVERLKQKPGITYRRLLWRPEHLDWLADQTDTYNTIEGAEFRYFEAEDGLETPILPCAVVDEKVVNFGWGYLGRAARDEVNITLTHKDAANAFVEYFQYLWDRSDTNNLKGRGLPIDVRRLNSLRMRLKGRTTAVQIGQEDIKAALTWAYQGCRELNVVSLAQMDTPAAADTFPVIVERLRKGEPLLTVRMLFWTVRQLTMIEGLAKDYDNFAGLKGLEIVYYVSEGDAPVSLLPCVIVDGSFVNFGLGYLGQPRMGKDVNISVGSPVVELFNEHFSHLWLNPNNITLKRPDGKLNLEAIKDIRERKNED